MAPSQSRGLRVVDHEHCFNIALKCVIFLVFGVHWGLVVKSARGTVVDTQYVGLGGKTIRHLSLKSTNFKVFLSAEDNP